MINQARIIGTLNALNCIEIKFIIIVLIELPVLDSVASDI